MIIAIDVGNSRIKWGVYSDGGFVKTGALGTDAVESLSTIAMDWPAAPIVACNVAGGEREKELDRALSSRAETIVWLRAAPHSAGIQSRYDSPESLGADRWAALIGARAHREAPCLVVSAGTATTIDLIDDKGIFHGGGILPGLSLMQKSLAHNTAQLPLSHGRYQRIPTNTQDAIFTACVEAQVGAIERFFYRHAKAYGESLMCLITGGAAPSLLPHFSISVRHVEGLVLKGLVAFYQKTYGV